MYSQDILVNLVFLIWFKHSYMTLCSSKENFLSSSLLPSSSSSHVFVIFFTILPWLLILWLCILENHNGRLHYHDCCNILKFSTKYSWNKNLTQANWPQNFKFKLQFYRTCNIKSKHFTKLMGVVTNFQMSFHFHNNMQKSWSWYAWKFNGTRPKLQGFI